jgi:hypothetical protein
MDRAVKRVGSLKEWFHLFMLDSSNCLSNNAGCVGLWRLRREKGVGMTCRERKWADLFLWFIYVPTSCYNLAPHLEEREESEKGDFMWRLKIDLEN